MMWQDLKKQALKEYYPGLFLERIVPARILTKISLWLSDIVLAIFIVGLIISYFGISNTAVRIWGTFLFFLSLWIFCALLKAFYDTYYFKSIPDAIGKHRPTLPITTFEVARILYNSSEDDLILGFVKTPEGFAALRRAGASPDDVGRFLAHRVSHLPADSVSFNLDDALSRFSFADYAIILFDNNHEFAEFLFSIGIQKIQFFNICLWVEEREVAEKKRERWWAREWLGRIPGIGKSWSYGRLYYMEKYERSLPVVVEDEYDTHDVYGSQELKTIEQILIRERGANVLLVGDDVEGRLEIVSRLNNILESGQAFPQIAHEQVFLLDTDLIFASVKTKTDFEATLRLLITEAANAGNIILTFPDFPAFLKSAEAIGSDAVSILDQFFVSPELHIIALADRSRYDAELEKNAALQTRFGVVQISEVSSENTVRVLENEIIPFEQKQNLFFTYNSLVAIAEDAERYISGGLMPDKAITLLFEYAAQVGRGKGSDPTVVHKDDIAQFVQRKTGIPAGTVREDERDTLLNLEKILHQRIIGQDEAVTAISNAVRRARSGVNNPARPLASFLFLGPTGVGKTETSKALADVFFGAQAHINRLDMSEYAGGDALAKLIGSHAGAQGVLPTLVREHPYGVLLLDEFEKTVPEVANIFLQVLDEGFFSDAGGTRVNCRNLLIIATSNAGAELIWDAIKVGKDLSKARDTIIDSIIHNGIFKPELLNRFDGLVIFHPLANEHLDKIAKLQLDALATRLAGRGLKLVVNQDLIDYVMKFGVDPKFGARPMARAVADKVEQVIADKIIRGEARPGQPITIVEKDLG